MAVRPVAISNSQRMAGIVDVAPEISDAQIAYEAGLFGLTVDCVAFSAENFGPVPPPTDGRVSTLQELANYLSTIPKI